MSYTKMITRFKPELKEAFVKMVLGINVEITEEERASDKFYENTGRWWFIKSIDADEKITIVSQNHKVMEGLNYKALKLNI